MSRNTMHHEDNNLNRHINRAMQESMHYYERSGAEISALPTEEMYNPNHLTNTTNQAEEKSAEEEQKGLGSILSAIQVKSILSKLDEEGMMLAALAWLLYKNKADTQLVLAILYIIFS